MTLLHSSLFYQVVFMYAILCRLVISIWSTPLLLKLKLQSNKYLTEVDTMIRLIDIVREIVRGFAFCG